jgi:hypothetical protein
MNRAIMFYMLFRRIAMTHIVSTRNHLHSGQCSFPTAYGIVLYVDTKAETLLDQLLWCGNPLNSRGCRALGRASPEESSFHIPRCSV